MPALPSLPARAATGLRRGAAAALAAGAVATGTGACGLMDINPASEVQEDITVFSPVIVDGEAVPERFTCEGEGISPPLQWSGFPADTDSVAVVLDAPQAPGGTLVKWVAFGLDPLEQEIGEGQPGSPARQALNSLEEAGYSPPCPEGEEADGGVYRFTVYALANELTVEDGAPLHEATAAIAAETLAYGRLVAAE